MELKNNKSTLSLEQLKSKYPEQYYHIKNVIIPRQALLPPNLEECEVSRHNYGVIAPVKSGKRYMVIISSLVQREHKHYFVSAFHRKADAEQRSQLQNYGINVHSIKRKKDADILLEEIEKDVKQQKKIIIHLDELDYGCGKNQNLSDIIKRVIDDATIEMRMYSATADVIKSEYLKKENAHKYCELLHFMPANSYFGIKKYCEYDRFKEAEHFFEVNDDNIDKDDCVKLGTQAIKLMKELIESTDPKKMLGVVRISGMVTKKKSRFQILKEREHEIKKQYPAFKNIVFKYYSSHDPNELKWDDKSIWETDFNPSKKYIIIINQSAGRSTEWTCQPYMLWYHCKRSDSSSITTIQQDQERVVYYQDHYHRNNTLILYGDLETAKYSAYGEAPTNRNIDNRIKKTKKGRPEIKVIPRIYNTYEEIPEEYRKKKESHVHEKYKLKNLIKQRNMISPIKTEIDTLYLEFFVGNVRSSRTRWIQGKYKTNPIIFRNQLENDQKEGISPKNTYRINLFYENGETNPNNYKFMLRLYDGLDHKDDYNNKTVTNTSAYNRNTS